MSTLYDKLEPAQAAMNLQKKHTHIYIFNTFNAPIGTQKLHSIDVLFFYKEKGKENATLHLQHCQHFILYVWWIEINEKRISNVAYSDDFSTAAVVTMVVCVFFFHFFYFVPLIHALLLVIFLSCGEKWTHRFFSLAFFIPIHSPLFLL